MKNMSRQIKGRWLIAAVVVLYILYLTTKYLIIKQIFIFVVTILSLVGLFNVNLNMHKNRIAFTRLTRDRKEDGWVSFSSYSDGVFYKPDLEAKYSIYKWFYVGFY